MRHRRAIQQFAEHQIKFSYICFRDTARQSQRNALQLAHGLLTNPATTFLCPAYQRRSPAYRHQLTGCYPYQIFGGTPDRHWKNLWCCCPACQLFSDLSLCNILDHRFGRQFLDKARGDRALPLAMDPATASKADIDFLRRARGDADIGQAALFFQTRPTIFINACAGSGNTLLPIPAKRRCQIPAPLPRAASSAIPLPHPSSASPSITSEICSRKPPAAYRNFPSRRSVRSGFPAALASGVDLSACHIAGIAGFIQHHLVQIQYGGSVCR
jgi:hypothetical protein